MTTENLKIVITADVQDAINKVKAVKEQVSDIGNTTGTAKVKTAMSGTNKEVEKLRNTLEKIPGVGGKISSVFGTIAKSVLAVSAAAATMIGWMKMAGSEVLGAFDFKNFDLGGDGLKGLIDTMKISFKEAGVSMAQAFGKGKAAASGAASASAEAGAAASGAGAAAGGAAAGFAALAAAVAVVAAAVITLVAAVKNAIRVSEQMAATFFEARKVGLSTSAYQKWGYVLGQVGVEADKLSDFIKSLSAAQNDLRDGTEAMVNAFADLGLSAEEAANMTQEQLFVETITRLQQMEDGIKRTSIAYRIFGEDDAAQVANILALNNEEMERMINNFYLLGGSASDSAVQKSLELQNALSNLRLAWQGLSNTLGEVFMPIITTVVNALTKAVAVVNMFLRAVFGFDIVSKGSESVNKATASVGGYSNSLKSATKAAEKLKRTTMGFDELNIVNNPNSSAGSGSSDLGGGGGGGSFEIPDISGMTQDLGLDKIADWFEKWKNVIRMAVPIALTAIGLIGCVACLFTGNFIGAIAFGAMAGIGIAIGVGNGAWEDLFKGIKDIWAKLKTWFNQKVKPIFTKEYWKKKWDEIKKAAKEKLKEIKKAITDKWDELKTWFNQNIKPIFTKAYWIKKWEEIKKAASDKLAEIKKAIEGKWNELKTWFNQNVKPIFTKAYWVKKWEDIKKAASDKLAEIKKTIEDKWAEIKGWFTTNVAPKFTKQYWIDKWNGLVQGAKEKLAETKKAIEDKWAEVKNWFNTNVAPKFTKQYWLDKFETIKAGAQEKLAAAKKTIEDKWTEIKNWFNTNIAPKFTKEYWLNKFETIRSSISDKLGEAKKAITDKWDELKNWFNTNVAPKFTKEYWLNKFDSVRAAVSEKIGAAKTAITNKWDEIKLWFNTNVAPKFTKDYWLNKFDSIRSSISEKIGEAKTAASTAWNGVKTWFTTNVAPKFTATYWTNKFDTIKQGMKSALNGVIYCVETAINWIVGKLNTVSFSIPDWVPKIGGKRFGISLPYVSIPRLATGGIVTDSILANIGEHGREAVLPLDRNTGWMDMLADRLAARIGGGSTRVVLQVDGRELGWATIEQINAITKQTGGLQLVL